MKCPLCNVDLVMSERQSIEIDYCPQCRGVWLDRGELDKIIERSAELTPVAAPRQDGRPDNRYDDRRFYDDRRSYDSDDRRRDDRDDHDDRKRYDDYKGRKKKKRPESFLSDLFEFGE